MKPYADTNFLTRAYLPQVGSEEADRLLHVAGRGKAPALPITWLHRLELLNAFEFSVWLTRHGAGNPTVNSQQAALARATFLEDLESGIFLRWAALDFVGLDELFGQIAARHTAKHGFRTYDILHVAMALNLGRDSFLSFDQRARKLAALEGLTVPD